MADTVLAPPPARQTALSGQIRYLVSGEESLSSADILSFSLQEGVNDGQLCGAVPSSLAVLKLYDPDGRLTAGHTPLGARVTLTLTAEGTASPLCVFIVSGCLRGAGQTLTLKGHDIVTALLGAEWRDELTYPVTLGTLAARIAGAAGLAVNDDFTGADTVIPARPAWGRRSLRAALGCAAGACGCFAAVSRTGTLEIRPVRSVSRVSLSADSVFSLSGGESVLGPVTGVRAACADGTNAQMCLPGGAVAEDTALLLADNPLFDTNGVTAYALLNAFLANAGGLVLAPFSLSWQGDASVCVGQRVLLTGENGFSFESAVTRQRFLWQNGLTVCTECGAAIPEPGGGLTNGRGGSVNAARLYGILDGSLLMEESVAASALTADSVTARTLSAGSVTADKLAANSVTARAIASDAVTADQLSAGCVTAGKLAAGAVTTDALAAGAVTAAQLRTGLITASSGLLADACVGGAQIADASVTDAKIVSLSANKLTAGTVDASVIRVVNLTADNITAGTLNGARVPVLGQEHLQSGAVTGEKLASECVTADKLVSGAVTTDKLAANAVTSGKLLAGAVTADKIAAGAVTAGKLAAASVRASNIAALDGELAIASGGGISVRSGGSLSMESGGRVTVDADDAGSYIRFGGTAAEPLFMLGRQGNVLAQNGSFASLRCGGSEVWTAARLCVSAVRPAGHGILWVAPGGGTVLDYVCAPASPAPAFGGYSHTESLSFTGDGQSVLRGGAFAYSVSLRLFSYQIPRDGVSVTVTARKGQAAVELYRESGIVLGVGDYLTVDTHAVPVTSAVNLCADPLPVTVEVTVVKEDPGSSLRFEYDRFLLRCASGTQEGLCPCGVYWIP